MSKKLSKAELKSKPKPKRPFFAMNLPNFLTILRIILVIPFMVLFNFDSQIAQIITLVVFVIASLTDFIDGRLARQQKTTSDFGAFLDPLADKILVNLCFLNLVSAGLVPVWLFSLILVRDFAVDGVRMMGAKNGLTIAASMSGKAKTMVQMWTLTFLLLNRILMNSVFATVNQVLLYIVLILTLVSGWQYLVKGMRELKIFGD